MAGNAASPQPQRTPQSVPTVRPLGNLPDRGNSDTGRALSYLRNRQGAANTNGRVLPTLQNPALMNAANDNDEEEAPDEYGAAQRESEGRMQAINQGIGEEDQGGDEGYDDYDQGLGDDESDAAFSDGQDQDAIERSRANEFARRQAMDANIAQRQAAQAAETEGGAADEQQAMAKKMAINKLKSMLKLEVGAVSLGLSYIIFWNYEVFIEKGQPTWKILLVVLVDLLSIFSMIVTVLAPLILIAIFAIGIGAALPGPLQDLFSSVIGSVL